MSTAVPPVASPVPAAAAVTATLAGSPDAIDGLAARILDANRRHPLVVLTTPAGAEVSDDALGASVRFDLETILHEVGDVAEVVVVPTGDLTMRLDGMLPDRWQVYGGAARSYPLRVLDDLDLRRSPLRFPSHGRERDTALLVRDAVQQAHAAGLYDRPPARSRTVSGSVIGFAAEGTRALVTLDGGGVASVWQELTVPPVPLEWTLAKGQRVTGVLDVDAGRLALDEVATTMEALAERFPHRSVTLALVQSVDGEFGELALHPSLPVRVHRTEVSPNPHDRLDLLLAEGEVVAVRVVHLAGGSLHLRLSDVDDDEPILPPVALVGGGGPWLSEGRPLPRPDAGGAAEVEASDVAAHAPSNPADAAEPATAAVPGPASDDEPVTTIAPPPRPIPGPGLRTVRSPATDPGPGPVVTVAAVPPAGSDASNRSALQTAQATVAELKARNAELERRVRELGIDDSALSRQRDELGTMRRHVRELQAELGDALRSNEGLRRDRAESGRMLMRARRNEAKAAGSSPSVPFRDRAAKWASAEAWVRHEVTSGWASRVSVIEQPHRPIGDFLVGDDFADSLCTLDDGQFGKAMKAVVDVVTGLAPSMPGRDLHRLRTGPAGSPYLVREDGARAMRCAIEQDTPGARRLHYWVLPGGRGVELGRVGVHDDVEM